VNDTWVGRPGWARALRVTLFLAPALFAWAAIRVTSPAFLSAEGWLRIPLWIAQALLVSLITARAFTVASQRLIPLTSLLSLALVFPDEAPSRFGIALRAGATKKLESSIPELPADEGEAARAAIELVSGFNHHDRLTRGHIERVRAYGEMIGAEMGLNDEELNQLRWGLLLHDVGKLGVPAEILQKDGRPTSEEWDVLKTHPDMGAEILKPLANFLGPWGRAAADHHERWDGSGYPQGLARTEISLAGRICAVADAYDVITSKRSYKSPQSVEFARKELVDNAGSQFDPVVVRAFLRCSLRATGRTGIWGWLFELPRAFGASAMASVPAAGVVGSIAATAIGLVTFANPSPAPPAELAFEQPASLEFVESLDSGDVGQTGVESAAIDVAPLPSTTSSSTTTTTSSIPAETADTTTPPSSTLAVTPDAPATTAAPVTTSTAPPASSTTAVVRTTIRPTTSTTTRPSTTTTTPPTTTSSTTTSTSPSQTSSTTIDPLLLPPSVHGTGFNLIVNPTVFPGDARSDTGLLFLEHDSVALPEDIEIFEFTQSPTQANTGSPITLFEGDVVCVWHFHWRPVNTADPVTVHFEFNRKVLGTTIPRRTSSLNLPGVTYTERDYMASDLVTQTEFTLTVELNEAPDKADGFRIILDCD